MTDTPIYFDTDCLSSFLWVRAEYLLPALYKGNIFIPMQVYTELSIPTIRHLQSRIDALIVAGNASTALIMAETAEYKHYTQMVSNPNIGHLPIGKGEASAIALAKASGGAVASNNLKDVKQYVEELGLLHITTGTIMAEAFQKSIITESQANTLWGNMIAKKRKLGAATFTEYMKTLT